MINPVAGLPIAVFQGLSYVAPACLLQMISDPAEHCYLLQKQRY
jgi:hypothetical protein